MTQLLEKIKKINMSTLNEVPTLVTISINHLCQCMDEDTLRFVLKSFPPLIRMETLWTALGLHDKDEMSPNEKGCEIIRMNSEPIDYYAFPEIINSEVFERFSMSLQIKFIDRYNFTNYFDHELFFELIQETRVKSSLFIIFQVCINIKGINFPSNFAQEWVNMVTLDNNEGIYFPIIEKGLKLGVFLGDAGWLVESALVLSHTHKIITTKWVCHDQNLKLLKTLQCLTKWLLVASNYHNFAEANEVLQNLLHIIDIFEQIEEKTLSISYSYLAVSQYYYVQIEYDKAWSWAVKAILELNKVSKLAKSWILNHSIKICSALNKFEIAQKLKIQLFSGESYYDNFIIMDFFENEEDDFYTKENPAVVVDGLHIALGISWSLFGYCNLHTANILISYASKQYDNGFPESSKEESLQNIQQAIFIMKKIGIPNDNMLLVNAQMIKSIILQDLVSNIDGHEEERTNQTEMMKQLMFSRVEDTCLNALQFTVQSLGENTLLTAKAYLYLGTLYIHQKKYTEAEQMFLKEIEIVKSIVGTDKIAFAFSTGHLAHLYIHYLNKFQEAELILLQSIRIYESDSDIPIEDFLFAVEDLIAIYNKLNNTEMLDYYTNYLEAVNATYDSRCLGLQFDIIEETCRRVDLSLEKIKCILYGCSCGQ